MTESHATEPRLPWATPAIKGEPSVKGPFYVLATEPPADEHGLILKHGETFAVFDHFGDIKPSGLGEEGLYHQGTRFLSCLFLGFEHGRPMFLSSSVRLDNELLTVDMTNSDMPGEGERLVPRGTVHLARTEFLGDGACYKRLHVRNYGPAPTAFTLLLHFEADFADIFEVRGTRRRARGAHLPEEVRGDGITLGYRGLDGVIRRTRVLCTPPPDHVERNEVRFALQLPPSGEATIETTILCQTEKAESPPPPFDAALASLRSARGRARRDAGTLRTSNGQFNAWTDRAFADLLMMSTQTSSGSYPYAGVPWFSCPFGRDGIITALECLWLWPKLARGVLAFLAATQAGAVIPEQDAEPGKILHETRKGEMAALGEIPFGRYYGSVDATPLFVLLAGAYYARTGDREFVEAIWPNVEAALRWIVEYGDRDGDGFVEYERRSPQGLVQQGWKDSHDSVFHADGSPARGPIALCEVQGYVYAARRSAAALAAALGHRDAVHHLECQARELQKRFEEAFWCEDLGIYALALDGDKQPCRVRTSNAGHCLFAGIAAPERARKVAELLIGPEMFSGWGVRTVASVEARYNPMSYHNGSIWPHDNGLIAAGFSRYRYDDLLAVPFSALFDASVTMDGHRLPELFCGFRRRPGEGPTLYPVACSPQAWAAGVVFQLMQSALRFSVDVRGRRFSIERAILPPFLTYARIRNIALPFGEIDLLFEQQPLDVSVTVLRKRGDFEVQILK